MKKAVFAVVLACVFVFGCVTTTKPTETIKSESCYYIIPEIGKETTSYIGEFLIKEGRTSSQYAIYLNNDHGTAGWTAFHPAGVYKIIGKKDGYTIYQHSSIMPGMMGNVHPQIFEDSDNNSYLKTMSGMELLNKSEYSKKLFVEETGDDFEQTLIYTGAEGTILKFSYREFSNNMARGAFTVDATYDIKTDKNIRFRGALLEIVKVDNQSITYKVLSGFRADK